MDNRRRIDLLVTSVAVLAMVAGCGTPQTAGRYAGPASRVAPKHVVVVGFDGLAAYAVTNSPTPAIGRMMTEGAGTIRSRSILPSASALNWHSFFTCSASEQHGYIAWNSKEPKFPAVATTERGLYPDVFSEFRRIRPDAEIGLFYEWGGIVDTLDTNACSMVERANNGAESVQRMCGYIEKAKPAFLAICLNEPDHAGHTFGWNSPEYVTAVRKQDGVLAKVLEAIERAGMADETVVVLFADHGGSGKRHGGPTLAEMERPSFFLGKGVKRGGRFNRPGAIYDDGATVAALLGIVDPPESWIGRPHHEIFELP